MNEIDLCFAGAAAQTDLVRSRTVSATELVGATLDRIDRLGSSINAYRTVFHEQALAAAAAIDERPAPEASDDLPLLGVPVAIKDNTDVAGDITMWGSDANTKPAIDDSPVVAALRQAGAIVIGKTNCSELTIWPITENERWGATRNPWNTAHSPGGSSGGSAAAVAAGLCGAALGSDGLGSIRVPSGFCGVFGLKPQRDRIPHGVGGWYGLSVNGPITRRVADAAVFLDAFGDSPQERAFHSAVTGGRPRLRVAVAYRPVVGPPATARPGKEQHDAVRKVARLLAEQGHRVIEQELDFDPSAGPDAMIRYFRGIADSESLVGHPDRLSPITRTMIRVGHRVSPRMLANARRREERVAEKLNRIFDDVDVVLTPGAVAPPLKIGQTTGKGGLATLQATGRVIPHYGIWNLVGQPAVSVPAGFDAHGLPLSVQFAGRAGDERTLLALSVELEELLGWPDHRPNL